MMFTVKKGCCAFAVASIAIFILIWLSIHPSSLSPEAIAAVHLQSNHREYVKSRVFDRHVPHKIPHIIHQTWNTYEVPVELAEWIKTWMKFNPDWEYWWWTPDEVVKLLKEKYPGYLDMYNRYKFTIFRADAMRYFIMDTFGGFYADLDMECLRPLDDWTFDHQCILSHEPYEHPYLLHSKTTPNVINTMMASRPEHPYFKSCIAALPEAASKHPTDVMRGTGPWFMDGVLEEFQKSQLAKLPENNITVVRPKYFLPTYDPLATDKLRKQCDVLRNELVPHALQVCESLRERNFTNEPLPESYTNHHWVHIFLQESAWRNKQKVVSIFKLVPNAKLYG